MSTFPWYTDAEIDDLCEGLKNNSAKVKYLQGLGLHVERKPNGKPLVIRAAADRVLAGLKQLEADEEAARQKPQPDDSLTGREEMIKFLQERRQRRQQRSGK